MEFQKNKEKKRKERPETEADTDYRPKRRSGGYAMIVELRFRDRMMTKSELGLYAQRWAKSIIVEKDSLKQPVEGSKNKLYDGFSNMKTLMAKGFVAVKNRTKLDPSKKYFLTKAGQNLADSIIRDDALTDEGPSLEPAVEPLAAAIALKQQQKQKPRKEKEKKRPKNVARLYDMDFVASTGRVVGDDDVIDLTIDDNDNDSDGDGDDDGDDDGDGDGDGDGDDDDDDQGADCTSSADVKKPRLILAPPRATPTLASQPAPARFISSWLCTTGDCFASNQAALTECARCGSQKDILAILQQVKALLKLGARSDDAAVVRGKRDLERESQKTFSPTSPALIALPTATTQSPYRSGQHLQAPGRTTVGDLWDNVVRKKWPSAAPAWLLQQYPDPTHGAGVLLLHQALDLVMVLDFRERELLESLVSAKKKSQISDLREKHGTRLHVEFRELKIGDVQWLVRDPHSGRELMLDVIAERKSVSDLFQSLQSRQENTNRYWEQKRRILQSGLSQRFYLVEGEEYEIAGYAEGQATRFMYSKNKEVGAGADADVNADAAVDEHQKNVDKYRKAYNSALLETATAGFQVLRTKDRLDTIETLLALSRRICLSPNFGKRSIHRFLHDPKVPKVEFHTFNHEMAVSKVSGPAIVAGVTEKMLFQIPRFGQQQVSKILKVYPTINSIITALHDCPSAVEAAKIIRKATGFGFGKPSVAEEHLYKIFSTEF